MKYFTPLRVALLLLLAVVVFWSVGFGRGNTSCAITYENRTVSGLSLAGFLEPGSRVRVAFGYYACNPVTRGDVVLYRDSGDVNPLIKIVKAVAGDHFALALAEGGGKLVVNGEVLKTTTGGVYRFSEASSRLLSLYERDYQGVVPEGAALILGNVPGGSRDSSQFGLISVDALIGKVIRTQ